MGVCRFCGQSAGFFSTSHKECEETHRDALTKLRALATSGAAGKLSLPQMESLMTSEASVGFVPSTSIRDFLIDGWSAAAAAFLADGLINKDEEKHLNAFATRYQLQQAELDRGGAFTQVVKALVMAEVLEGKIPDRVTISGILPFNFQKDELSVFVFQDVNYLEDKKRRHYVGGSSGASIRVAKGLYLRTSSFKGRPVDTTQQVAIGRGLLCVTTKHLYFKCPQKSIKIPHTKILTLEPFSDGVSIHRDATSAMPQFFINGDGWFLYNIIANAPNLEP